MRDHATVSATFWTRGTGKLLRGHVEAQLVAVYLMTCPAASMAGIFHIGLPTLCHETGLPLEGALKGLARCHDVGFCEYDPDEELMWVPNLTRYQVGSALKPNDKRKLGIARVLRPFVRHQFYLRFMEIYADAYGLKSLPEGPSPRPPPKGLPRVHVPDPDPVHPLPDSSGTGPEAQIVEKNGGSTGTVNEIIRFSGEDQKEPAEDPDPVELTSEQKYATAFVAGVSAGKGAPHVWAGGLDEQGALNRCLPAFARANGKALKGPALLAWIQSAATAFARFKRAGDPAYTGGYSAKLFAKWLNDAGGFAEPEPEMSGTRLRLPSPAEEGPELVPCPPEYQAGFLDWAKPDVDPVLARALASAEAQRGRR